MKKNILVISSSPRKGGNSDLLCDRFVDGALEVGHTASKISLRDYDIHPCTGCGSCVDSTRGCTQKDHMTDVLDRMVKADVIVMATPVYFYTMCGPMKTFIDRTCARHRELKDKELYFIATAADGNPRALERTIDGFRGWTDCLDDPKEKGILYGTGVWKKGEIKNSTALENAFQMGRNC